MFAWTADVYAPDDAGSDLGGTVRTTTSDMKLDPGSNVPALPGPPNALVAAAGLLAIIGLVHYFGRHKR